MLAKAAAKAKKAGVTASARAQELNEKYQIDKKWKAGVKVAEEKISEAAEMAKKEARELDDTYKISDKAKAAKQEAMLAANAFYSSMQNELAEGAAAHQARQAAGASASTSSAPTGFGIPPGVVAGGAAGAAAGGMAMGGGKGGEDVEDSKLCSVCLDGEKTECIRPCGHVCLCGDCARQMVQTAIQTRSALLCPICRTAATEVFRIYM